MDEDDVGDQDDEHEDDENVGSRSKNKSKGRVPNNDDPKTLIEMLALVACEGDETKVAEEHVCTGMTLVTCLSSAKFDYRRKRKKSPRAYRGKISTSLVYQRPTVFMRAHPLPEPYLARLASSGMAIIVPLAYLEEQAASVTATHFPHPPD